MNRIKLLIIILVLVKGPASAQDKKVINLASLMTSSELRVEKVELMNEGLFGLPKKIDVYNLFYLRSFNGRNPFITITLLPSLESGSIEYVVVNDKSDISLTVEDLMLEWQKRTAKTNELIDSGNRPNDWVYSKHYLKSDEFKLYIWKENKYWIVKTPVLVEFYEIVTSNKAFGYSSAFGQLNLLLKEYSTHEFELDLMDDNFKYASLNSSGRFFLDHKKSQGREDDFYTFWSLPVLVYPQNEFHNGIGSFTFSKQYGVIEGEYRYYFEPALRSYFTNRLINPKEIEFLVKNLDLSYSWNSFK